MKPKIPSSFFLNNVVSPFGLALISSSIFLVGWLMPAATYSAIIGEQDFLHLDPETFLFFTLCVAGFLFGVALFDFLLPSKQLLTTKRKEPQIAGIYLVLPLVITTLLSAAQGYEYFQSIPNLFVLLVAQQGSVIKNDLQDVNIGIIALADSFHVAVLWWTYWRISNSNNRPRWRPLYVVVFLAAVFVEIFLNVLKVSRADLMPMMGGLIILYLMGKLCRGELNSRRLLTLGVALVGGVACLFTLFSFARGLTDSNDIGVQISGYTIASYNRLAAMLHGRMYYPYGGRGAYLAPFAYNHRLNQIIPIKDALNWPDAYELWGSEFQAVQVAGLNPVLIWAGAFGDLLADFGWGAVGILVVYGLMYGFVWSRAKAATAFGVILYPWFGACVLIWFSGNLLMEQRLPIFLITALILTLHEKLFSVRSPSHREARITHS